jgi:hypothetical protein
MHSRSLTKTILIVLAVLNSTASQGVDMDMNFDGGAVGSKAESGICDVNGDPVTIYASAESYYRDDESYGPGQSVELNIRQSEDGYGNFGGIITLNSCGGRDLVKGDEIWIRLRAKFPLGFDYTAKPRLKFLRIRTNKYADCETNCNEGYIDWYINPRGSIQGWYDENGKWVQYADIPYGIIKEAVSAPLQNWKFFGDKTTSVALDQWLTYEWYVKLDSKSIANGGEAIIRAYKDGVLMAEITDRRTLDTDNSVATDFLFFTYWNGLSPKTQKMYIDDLRIVTTPDIPSDVDTDSNPVIGMGNSTTPKPPVIGSQ